LLLSLAGNVAVAISIFIIVISTLLFVYWFRYTCVLMLRTRAREHAHRVAEVNHLSFLKAQKELESAPGQQELLDTLHQSLDRDYRVLSYLLRHTGTQSGASVEEHLLRIDYHMMRALYYLARPFSPKSARQVLIERASIVSHLANAMGERVALP
jgi:hypothetical protein